VFVAKKQATVQVFKKSILVRGRRRPSEFA